MRLFAVAVATICTLVFTNAGVAAPVLITFDTIAPNTIIEGVDIGGVTLTGGSTIASGGGGVGSISAPNSAWNNGFARGAPLVLTFTDLVDSVSLFGGDQGGDTDQFRLTAYDDSNNIIAVFTTPVFGGGPIVGGIMGDNFFASVAAPGIRRVEVQALINSGIGIDNLQFNVQAVPEPASMLAWGLITGVGLVGYRLRRRKVNA